MAPAQVPKVGVFSTKDLRVSKKSLRSRNLSMVVDSPPGMMQAVDAFEIRRRADEFRGCSEETQSLGMGFICALQREDTDGEGIGHVG